MHELLSLKGIGEKTLKHLETAHIFTYDHLINTFPKRYEELFLTPINQVDDQAYTYFKTTVLSRGKVAYIRKNLQIISFYIETPSGKTLVKAYNQTYILKLLNPDTEIVIYGKKHSDKQEILASKILLERNFNEGIYPVYNIKNITDNSFLKYVKAALKDYKIPPDPYPKTFIDKHELLPYNAYIKNIHEPLDLDNLKAIKKRQKYTILFDYQLKVNILKTLYNKQPKPPKNIDLLTINKFIVNLPFPLTNAQQKVIKEIQSDLAAPFAMKRILQGDTGSGKTLVAFIAALTTITNKEQVAFMAPTEILAMQHYETIKGYLKHTDYTVDLLTGSTSSVHKKAIYQGLKMGTIDIIVGTHALFSKQTPYTNLGLVITDEQHRFGVNQRDALKDKDNNPDVLYLSATPIPRTLAQTLFSDMSISVLDERPPNRKKIKTVLTKVTDKETVQSAIKETLFNQEQIFIVVPNIETNVESNRFGAKAIYEVIKKRYPNYTVDLIHGQLDEAKKTKTLKAFKDLNIDILVSTTVIEVGIDMPYATLMIIYHAERFGYAQLHQLRGRVGRSELQGTCLLLYEGSDETYERLSPLETIDDGFKLSELDLSLRGFGDLIGTLQSGKDSIIFDTSINDLDLLKTIDTDTRDIVDAYQQNQHHKALISSAIKAINSNN